MHYVKRWMLLWKSSSRRMHPMHLKVQDNNNIMIVMQNQSYWTRGGEIMHSTFVGDVMSHTLEGQSSVQTNKRVNWLHLKIVCVNRAHPNHRRFVNLLNMERITYGNVDTAATPLALFVMGTYTFVNPVMIEIIFNARRGVEGVAEEIITYQHWRESGAEVGRIVHFQSPKGKLLTRMDPHVTVSKFIIALGVIPHLWGDML